jgi:hypothetical protein
MAVCPIPITSKWPKYAITKIRYCRVFKFWKRKMENIREMKTITVAGTLSPRFMQPHSGFTGEGYVDTYNQIGSYIEVDYDAPKAGLYNLGIRYVHGKADTRPAELIVNGKVANPSIPFTTTGEWTVWTIITTPIELQAGRNVIRLVALGTQGLVNIDHFSFFPEEISNSKK